MPLKLVFKQAQLRSAISTAIFKISTKLSRKVVDAYCYHSLIRIKKNSLLRTKKIHTRSDEENYDISKFTYKDRKVIRIKRKNNLRKL